MNDALLEAALRDEDQTRERIGALELEIASARLHLDDIEVFKRLLTDYDAVSQASTDESAARLPDGQTLANAEGDLNEKVWGIQDRGYEPRSA